MKNLITVIAAFLLIFSHNPTPALTSQAGISADNFIQLVSSASQYVRIEGKVCNSQVTDHSKVIFLNFGRNFNTSLSAVIYNTDIPAFIDAGITEPSKYFNNKKVVIEGFVRINEGKPEVIIYSPGQIRIVEK